MSNFDNFYSIGNHLLLWIAVGFFIIGIVVLSLIKRIIDSKKNATTQFIVWWIVGTTGWGVASIILFMWWFSKI